MSATQTKRMKEILVLAVIFVSLSFVVQAATFATTSQSEFNEGTYVRTFYNTSGFVQLNASMLNGSYVSKVFDAGKNAEWQSILWTEGTPYGKELPNNQATETYLGGANMTRNVLLVHFNNDTGENATFTKDWSGFGNNGKEKSEGCIYKNAIGCYMHGSLLPKNPHLADWLIKQALEVKYEKEINLDALNDSLESQAHIAAIQKFAQYN